MVQRRASAKQRRLRPEAMRANKVRHLYGLEPEQLALMYAAQNERCAICGALKKLYIDHDHATGRVRGLLCNRCNLRMAAADDAEWTEKARGYARRGVARQVGGLGGSDQDGALRPYDRGRWAKERSESG